MSVSLPSPATVPGLGEPSRTPARRMAPEQRRMHLIEVAADLYAQRTFDQVSVDDITEAAGVSRALFYRYFAGPREIFTASTELTVQGLIREFTHVPHDVPLLEQMHLSLRAFFDFARSNSASYVGLLRNAGVQASTGTDAIIEQVRARSVEEILDRIGIPAPTPLLLLTMQNWVLMVENTTLAWLSDDRIARTGLEEWLTGQLLAMTMATAEADPETAELVRDVLTRFTASLTC